MSTLSFLVPNSASLSLSLFFKFSKQKFHPSSCLGQYSWGYLNPCLLSYLNPVYQQILLTFFSKISPQSIFSCFLHWYNPGLSHPFTWVITRADKLVFLSFLYHGLFPTKQPCLCKPSLYANVTTVQCSKRKCSAFNCYCPFGEMLDPDLCLTCPRGMVPPHFSGFMSSYPSDFYHSGYTSFSTPQKCKQV